MSIPHLPIAVFEHFTERPPKRKLKLGCHVTNPASFNICILDSWIRVEAFNVVLAEGRIFQHLHTKVNPAIIQPGKEGLGYLHIELPAQVLQSLEGKRAGGDVTLAFYSQVLVSEVSPAEHAAALKPPYETQFDGKGGTGGRVEYHIPQSEWLKILKGLGWSELEILEIPSTQLRSSPLLARALERFEDAQQNYRNGDWEETMMNCRKSFEAIVRDGSGELDMSKIHKVFVSILGEGEKTDRFDKLAQALGGFLHLGRHENPIHNSIKRVDAELALLLTGAMLRYLGSSGA